MWRWSHLFTIPQILRNVSISNSGYVIWVLPINRKPYGHWKHVILYKLGMYSVYLYGSRWLASPHIVFGSIKFYNNEIHLIALFNRLVHIISKFHPVNKITIRMLNDIFPVMECSMNTRNCHKDLEVQKKCVYLVVRTIGRNHVKMTSILRLPDSCNDSRNVSLTHKCAFGE